MANESVLTSIKKLLGIVPEYTVFDDQILLYINGSFSTLHQLGIGPEEGFEAVDDTTTWDELISEPRFNFIKSYIYAKVRILFDPPTSSFALESLNKQIAEWEERIIWEKENGDV